MPSISNVIARFTKQTMVYWQKIGANPEGRPVYAAPIQMPVRWEDRQREILSYDGRKIWSKGYLLLSTPVIVGSWVYLGTLVQVQGLPGYPNPPTNNQGGREVLRLDTTPDIKNQGNVYEAWL